MQASGDNLIYQLTNVGASPQPPPQLRSPIRTPKTSSAGSTPSRDGLATISPSKGRRWADKLAKFQKYTDKKKSNSSSENGRISTSPVVPQMLPLVINSHGTRTSSLPRPPETFELGGPTFAPPPPKLGTFGHSRPNISSKKSFLNEYCTVCDEPVLNRGSGERIIELECNHISHEECLLVSFENESNGYNPADFFSIFPPCNRCYNSKKVENRCVPKNDELKDRLISIFLIKGHTRLRNSEAIKLPSPTVPLLPLLVPNNLSPSPKRPSSWQVTHQPHSDTLKTTYSKTNRVRPDSVSGIIKNKQGAQEVEHERPVSQPISRYSPLRGSMISKRKMENYSLSSSDKLTLYVLRAHFIEILIKNFTTLSGWQIDEQFGLLRIVDHLMVSRNGIDYRDCWCMLFEKALLVAPIVRGVSANQDAFSDTFLQDFHIYKSLTSVIVDIVESSILKWTFPTNDSSPWQEVYVTEALNTDASQVVQKWTTAILDLELEFSEKYFTSTLPPPLIMRNEIESAHLSSSLMGMVTSTKVVELAGSRRSSLIVRRGVKLSEDQGTGLSAMDTMQSVMTSVSSILSLKREKPDELIVVLQMDFKKIKAHNEALVVFNSLRALGLKFPDMKICIVDMEGFTRVHGKARELITTVEDLTGVQRLPKIRFEPIQLKNMLYPGATLKNLGIAVVSNTSMDEQKSCLLKDYSCFTCEGRRRPREVKVRVGYLNLDYSDKISELVELGSWDDFLEALSYSFGLAFGDDDDDDDISTMDETITDSENDQLIEEGNSMSSNGSKTTILIASPFKESESNSKSPSGNNNDDNVGTMCYPSSSMPSVNLYSKGHVPQSTSNKIIRDECDFLLRDIECAIREIDEISSPSPTDSNSHPSAVYQYI